MLETPNDAPQKHHQGYKHMLHAGRLVDSNSQRLPPALALKVMTESGRKPLDRGPVPEVSRALLLIRVRRVGVTVPVRGIEL